jgi:hypothetical protein
LWIEECAMNDFDNSQRAIKVAYNHQPLQSLNDTFKSLNLSPAFQRKSVWAISDRKKFINTILEGMPCPTIFLFKRWNKKKKIYVDDVIDGKQRLETIFLFSNRLSHKKIQVAPDKIKKIKEWIKQNNISKLSNEQQKDFWSFQIPIGTIQMKDDSDDENQGISDLIEAFVRINTQGRPLSKQERLNAKYIRKPVLTLAKTLSKQTNKIFIISAEQKGRMKDIEVTLELLISIIKNEILNKKIAIERVLGEDFTKQQLNYAKTKYNKIHKVFDKLELGRSTRFTRKSSDFYSLFTAIMELVNSGCVFEQYSKASKELTDFSAKVAEITNAYQNSGNSYLKKIAGKLTLTYWLTTQKNTDSKEHRKIRSDILKEILSRSFDRKKDKNRFFSVAQKEQIWQKSRNKRCCYPGCTTILKWESATVDHIFPWSLGGATDVANGQLMCKKHNSMKKDKKNFSRFSLASK